ncbi:MAG: hypothetical protein FWF35_04220 [Elusimicrobia bacterium]|nr:hypothetical protein [Elusimicrobiota bacterium]
MLYNDLLKFSYKRLKDFFKNVSTFENQFEWTEFSNICYNKMYGNNSYERFCTTAELRKEIPELPGMCKKCREYFLHPRNKSKVVYDVMMGRLFEDILIDFLNSQCKIKAARADNQNKKYPDCMILGKDKGILAYFEVKYHCAPFILANQKIGRYCYEGSATLDQKKIIKQLEIIESDIDRPVFYLHWIDYPCLKGVFFETSEQIKDYLYNPDNVFKRQRREGDNDKGPQSVYLHKVYSPLLSMGSFEEFAEKIKGLEK